MARAPISRSRLFATAIHDLAACMDPAVLLDLEGTVLFVNDAWERFARVGEGVGEASVGMRLVEGVRGAEPQEALHQVLARVAREAGAASITFECNSPDLARLVTLHLSPVMAGPEPIGLSLVQRVVRELPVAEVYPVVEGSAGDYRAQDGTLEQCSCCRRTRRPADPEEWDFVPALVAAPPPDTVFGYCPLCRELHAPVGRDEDR